MPRSTSRKGRCSARSTPCSRSPEVGSVLAVADAERRSADQGPACPPTSGPACSWTKLGKKVDPSTQPSQSSKLAQYLGQVSKQMGLQTNPRYGVWDASSLRVVSDANTLSQPGTNELTQMQQLQQQQGTP